MNLKLYMKAIVGAIIAGLTGVSVALDDNSISAQEGVTSVIALLTALGVIWAVPNKEE